jgi:hypothetical protein
MQCQRRPYYADDERRLRREEQEQSLAERHGGLGIAHTSFGESLLER